MKTKSPSHLSATNLFLIGLIVAVILAGVFFQGWIRIQTQRAAERIQEHEIALRDLKRSNDYVDSRIAQLERPDELIRRIDGRLQRPDEARVVWVRRVRDGSGLAAIAYSRGMDVALVRSPEAGP